MNPAAVWPNESDDHVKTGGLPGAVRTEKPDDLAGTDVDVDPVHDRATAVDFYDFLSLENILFGCWILLCRGRR